LPYADLFSWGHPPKRANKDIRFTLVLSSVSKNWNLRIGKYNVSVAHPALIKAFHFVFQQQFTCGSSSSMHLLTKCM
jgi:hypothetical protein